MAKRPQLLHPAHAVEHPALTGATVGIISPDHPMYCGQCGGGSAPNGLGQRACTQCGQPAPEDNFERLQQELDAQGLEWESTRGKYNQTPERSFIVHNPTLDQLTDLGRRFGQESVVWSHNGRHQLVYTHGPNAGQATPPTSGKSEKFQWSPQQEPDDNYTVVPGPNGEPYGYFSYNLDFDNPMVPVRAGTSLQRSEQSPLAVAVRVLNEGVIAGWHEALLDMRMRELAKAAHHQPKVDPSMDKSKCKSCGQKTSPVRAALKKTDLCPTCTKGESMSTPTAPKPPQAGGAKPVMPGSVAKSEASARVVAVLQKASNHPTALGRQPLSSVRPDIAQAVKVPDPKAQMAAGFRPASPGAAGAPAMPTKPASLGPILNPKAKPAAKPAPKHGLIAKLRGIVGAPMAKP